MSQMFLRKKLRYCSHERIKLKQSHFIIFFYVLILVYAITKCKIIFGRNRSSENNRMFNNSLITADSKTKK